MLFLILGSSRASEHIHAKLLYHVLRAPMTYFDKTPMGRIMNRFAPEIETIDNILPGMLRQWFLALTYVIAVLVIIIYSVPWMVFAVVPVVTIFVIVQVQNMSLHFRYTFNLSLITVC